MTANKTRLTSGLTIFTLVMLITGSIDSIRNLPATALFGSTLIFFFIVSAITFLIPASLVSAELASGWNKKSGIYEWTKSAFGKKTAFFAVWLQWINTMVWYPTILSFIAATAAFLIKPHLATNKLYLISVILVTFWVLTLINLKGVQASAWFAKVCGIFGMVIPMLLIIALFLVWVFIGKPLQIHLNSHNIFPSLHHGESWISLTAIMTTFLGMELAAVHVNNINNPQRNFPIALLYSTIFILVTMILGSLAIAYVLPKAQINLVDGVMVAFSNFLQAFHLKWFMPIITAMLLIGSLGGTINWIISPAKGLLHAAQDGYMPKLLQQENKHGVAQNLLLLQAILVTLLCLAFLLMPSVNGSYWLLTDLSTQLYMIMYLVMFATAITLRYKCKDVVRHFSVPGGNFGMWLTGGLGIIGSLVTLVVGFFPPDGINVGSMEHFETMFVGGMLLMIAPVLLFYGREWFGYATTNKILGHAS